MTGPKRNREFCFPKILNVALKNRKKKLSRYTVFQYWNNSLLDGSIFVYFFFYVCVSSMFVCLLCVPDPNMLNIYF